MNPSIMVRAGFRGNISVAMTNVECATTGYYYYYQICASYCQPSLVGEPSGA